jgi:hypothetical protein
MNTTKYRRRQAKERRNKIEHAKKNAEIRAADYARREAWLEVQRRIYREKLVLIKGLQNILISRMYQLDPEEAKALMSWHQLRQIWGIFTGKDDFEFITHFTEKPHGITPELSQSPDIFLPDISIEF